MNPLRIRVAKIVLVAVEKRPDSIREQPVPVMPRLEALLGVLGEKHKAPVAFAVSRREKIVRPIVSKRQRQPAVFVARPENADHKVHQIVDVDQHGIVGIARAVGIEPLHAQVVCVARIRRDVAGLRPQIPPGVRRSGGCFGLIQRSAGGLDDVVIVVVAAQIRLAVVLLGSLLGLIKSPVLAVDVQVVIAAAGVGLAHVPLQVAGVDVEQKRHLGARLKRPGVVLHGAQVELAKLIDAFVAEQRIIEPLVAVLLAEEKPKGVLGVTAAGAEVAARANPGVDLKARSAVGMDQLNRGGALPGLALSTGVHVKTGLRIDQVLHVDDHRNGRNRLERRDELRAPHRIVDNVGVHAVVKHLPVDAARRPQRRRLAIGALADHIVQEDICLRVDVAGDETVLVGGGPQRRSAINMQRRLRIEHVGRRIGRLGQRAVGRVIDLRPGRVG